METPHALEPALEALAAALDAFEQAPPLDARPALAMLLARDAVAAALEQQAHPPATAVDTLLALDQRLRRHAAGVAQAADLAAWRVTLNPPASAWWWFFSPPPITDPRDRYNWLWNSLSMACLTAFVAYMASLVPRFAVNGFDILESFGVIGPSGLLTLAFSSLQGGTGRHLLDSILERRGIPSHYQSEFTFALSLLLLLAAIGVQASLPRIAEAYFRRGQDFYNEGMLRDAAETYEQALAIDPHNHPVSLALGVVYESLDDVKQAEEQYQTALKDGLPLAFNHLGRIYRKKGELFKAEALLRMGLQRTDEPQILYHLQRNLGWALLDQKRYAEAAEHLDKALEEERRIGGKFIGGGMAHCLLARVEELRNRPGEAQRHWAECRDTARPETLAEYQWLIEVGRRDLADAIDTSSVVHRDGKH